MRDGALTIGVVAIAILLRLPQLAARGAPLAGDEPIYHATARQLLETGRYLSVGEPANPSIGQPTAFRNPGLPVTLAAIYAVAGGPDPAVGRLAVCLLSLGALPAIVWLGRVVFRDRRVGLGAAVAYAAGRDVVHSSTTLLAEGLAAALLAASVALCIRSLRRASVATACGAGALSGLAILFRVHVLLAVILIGLVVLRRNRATALAFFCSAAVLPGAWATRNALVLGTPALTTQTISLWMGHNSFTRGGWPGDWPSQRALLIALYPDFDRMDEVARAQVFRREAWRELKAHPLRSLALVPKKIAIALSPWSYLGMDWAFAIVLPLALVGLAAAFSSIDRQELRLLVAPIAGLLVTCAVVFGEPRFRSVVDPFFALFAAYGALRVVGYHRPTRI